MKAALPVVLVGLAAGWWAFQEEPAPRIPQDIQPGHRAEVRLKNGHRFLGEVVAVTPNSITIDVQWEYANVTGTITFRKYMIEAVTRVEDLSTEQILERIRQKADALERLEEAATRNRQVVESWWDERAGAAMASAREAAAAQEMAERQERERLEAMSDVSAAVYSRFPEPEWNDSKYQLIKSRLDLGQGDTLTALEKEFAEKYGLWVEGRRQALRAASEGETGAGTGTQNTGTAGAGGTTTP